LEIKQIVHRDIKPANMLINKNAVVKLCDFGISRTFSERKVEEDRILGTANYMPLTLTHTIQDDMWALGISLLEIINGKNPFHDWNSYGQAFGILRWTPSVPTTISVDMHELILQL
jgi:serine/threonine protein kinase